MQTVKYMSKIAETEWKTLFHLEKIVNIYHSVALAGYFVNLKTPSECVRCLRPCPEAPDHNSPA